MITSSDWYAQANGGRIISTACPMCQMNLEAFQGPAGRAVDKDLHISILYLPQLILTTSILKATL